MGQSVPLVDGDGVGDAVARVEHDAGGTAGRVQGQHGLDRHVHGGRVEGLEHDLKCREIVTLSDGSCGKTVQVTQRPYARGKFWFLATDSNDKTDGTNIAKHGEGRQADVGSRTSKVVETTKCQPAQVPTRTGGSQQVSFAGRPDRFYEFATQITSNARGLGSENFPALLARVLGPPAEFALVQKTKILHRTDCKYWGGGVPFGEVNIFW